MTDSQTRTSEEMLNEELLKQAEKLLKQSLEFDKSFRESLKKNWKDKLMVSELSDAINSNSKTIEDLKNEIKDRNSRVFKK